MTDYPAKVGEFSLISHLPFFVVFGPHLGLLRGYPWLNAQAVLGGHEVLESNSILPRGK